MLGGFCKDDKDFDAALGTLNEKVRYGCKPDVFLRREGGDMQASCLMICQEGNAPLMLCLSGLYSMDSMMQGKKFRR